MLSEMLIELRRSLLLLIVLTALTGVAYPLLVTGISTLLFPDRAAGSLIGRDGRPAARGADAAGSALIGQSFTDPKHFWSRPSATSPYPYNASSSGGSNLGPLNPALTEAVAARIKALRDADPGNHAAIPADLVTASGSGLDPHMSPAAAAYQVPRVARVRGLAVEKVRALVAQSTEGRQLWLLGEPRVNVLELNLALDQLK